MTEAPEVGANTTQIEYIFILNMNYDECEINVGGESRLVDEPLRSYVTSLHSCHLWSSSSSIKVDKRRDKYLSVLNRTHSKLFEVNMNFFLVAQRRLTTQPCHNHMSRM